MTRTLKVTEVIDLDYMNTGQYRQWYEKTNGAEVTEDELSILELEGVTLEVMARKILHED